MRRSLIAVAFALLALWLLPLQPIAQGWIDDAPHADERARPSQSSSSEPRDVKAHLTVGPSGYSLSRFDHDPSVDHATLPGLDTISISDPRPPAWRERRVFEPHRTLPLLI